VEPENVCKAHSGLMTNVENLKTSVSGLWEKWDSIQKAIIVMLVTLVLNLIGVIYLISQNGN